VKKLFLDIELAPNLATVWGIWNQNIGINQLHETARMLCFAAKWEGSPKVIFYSEYKHGREKMLEALWELLNEADAVIHYNGRKFDVPHINREFLEDEYLPPDPYQQIDLLKTVKKEFRFVSNKLNHVTQELGIGKKIEHEGHQLWLDCMDGKPKAWAKMEKYNKQDVVLLEELYAWLRPWIKDHPNHALFTDMKKPTCTNCGSTNVVKKGLAHTNTMSYQRYRCNDCGTPLRGRVNVLKNEQRENVLTQEKI